MTVAGKPLRAGHRAQLHISECDLMPEPVNPDARPAAWQTRRTIVGRGAHIGEILRVAKRYAWIKLHGPVPSEPQATLSAWNEELRITEAERGRNICDGATGNITFMVGNNVVLVGLGRWCVIWACALYWIHRSCVDVNAGCCVHRMLLALLSDVF